ncbi:hypothetical protein OROMI_021050 [Orobanche minor]
MIAAISASSQQRPLIPNVGLSSDIMGSWRRTGGQRGKGLVPFSEEASSSYGRGLSNVRTSGGLGLYNKGMAKERHIIFIDNIQLVIKFQKFLEFF